MLFVNLLDSFVGTAGWVSAGQPHRPPATTQPAVQRYLQLSGHSLGLPGPPHFSEGASQGRWEGGWPCSLRPLTAGGGWAVSQGRAGGLQWTALPGKVTRIDPEEPAAQDLKQGQGVCQAQPHTLWPRFAALGPGSRSTHHPGTGVLGLTLGCLAPASLAQWLGKSPREEGASGQAHGTLPCVGTSPWEWTLEPSQAGLPVRVGGQWAQLPHSRALDGW